MKKFSIFLLLVICMIPVRVNALEVQVTTKKGLFVRESPNGKANKVGGLVYNTKVSVEEGKFDGYNCSDGWYKINSGKYNGNYICSNYVKSMDNTTSTNEITNTTTNTQTTTNTTPNNTESSEPVIFEEKVFTITTPLNLRVEPTTKSTTYGKLAVGKNYLATDRVIAENSGCKSNTWYKIQVDEKKSGYVCSAYTKNGASTDKYMSTCSDPITQEKANSLGVSTTETFVEVDTGNQKVTLYKDGICTLTTSIVSGKSNPADQAIETTPGSFKITEKSKNKYFTSSNVFSNYWMRFNLGMGLHDADNWRSAYGYKGSHGCVNMPLSATKIIWDNVEVGTRVIVHQ